MPVRVRGLSPRLRGNGITEQLTRVFQGSIPALAGERPVFCAIVCADKVYPRACGGTVAWLLAGAAMWGLSPRLRGNASLASRPGLRSGSIPALAGERQHIRAGSYISGVYPRACGGTLITPLSNPRLVGLSPRLRGNAFNCNCCRIPCGSIPALAGERIETVISDTDTGVYPRACGGTRARYYDIRAALGLSPRLRGNGRRDGVIVVPLRSIPALAGERHDRAGDVAFDKVYPRACGGTQETRWGGRAVAGLSPRLRGNVSSVVFAAITERSIPALAGERVMTLLTPVWVWVYPRACGGTLPTSL